MAYRDWVPGSFGDPTYNAAGAQPDLESWQANIPRPLPLQPVTFYDNRRSPAQYYEANIQALGYTLDELYPYPVATEIQYVSPAQPIRADIFNQLAVRVRGTPVAGSAPTTGIYTGTSDLSDL